jgi:hypothetical protein
MQNMNKEKSEGFDLKEFVMAHFDFLGAKFRFREKIIFRLKNILKNYGMN